MEKGVQNADADTDADHFCAASAELALPSILHSFISDALYLGGSFQDKKQSGMFGFWYTVAHVTAGPEVPTFTSKVVS